MGCSCLGDAACRLPVFLSVYMQAVKVGLGAAPTITAATAAAAAAAAAAADAIREAARAALLAPLVCHACLPPPSSTHPAGLYLGGWPVSASDLPPGPVALLDVTNELSIPVRSSKPLSGLNSMSCPLHVLRSTLHR